MCEYVCESIREKESTREKPREHCGAGWKERGLFLLREGTATSPGELSLPAQAGGHGAVYPKSLSSSKSLGSENQHQGLREGLRSESELWFQKLG